jgi:23S rRNA-/tRNA-specific pseudouridylate synthase
VSRTQRWVLGQAGPVEQTLAERDLTQALRDGRVFVNGRRAAAGAVLRVGDVVEVAKPRVTPTDAVRILSSRNGIIAAVKPAGMPTEPDRRGSSGCLLDDVAHKLGVDSRSLHAASRLDLGVSGVVLLGASRQARQRLARWRQTGSVGRRYVAIAAGAPETPRNTWHGRPSRDSRPAVTHYAMVDTLETARPGVLAVLALSPVTGRTHQLRAHCAAGGAPLLGDRAYGGPRHIVDASGAVTELDRVTLHAAWVQVPGGEGGVTRYHAPVPGALQRLWERCGGSSAVWSAASETVLP